MQTATANANARLKAAKRAAAAERKAEAELNIALTALRNQQGGYLDDDLEEAKQDAADWKALALVAGRRRRGHGGGHADRAETAAGLARTRSWRRAYLCAAASERSNAAPWLVSRRS